MRVVVCLDLCGLMRLKQQEYPFRGSIVTVGFFFSPFSIYNHVCQRFIDQNTSLILFTFTA